MKKTFLIIALIAALFCFTPQVLAVATTNCTDTDSGQNLSVKGTVNYIYNGQNKSAMDYCPDSSKLVEYYCSSGSVFGITKVCVNGCLNGVCNSEHIATTKCSDSDSGRDFFVRGAVTDVTGAVSTDYCVGDSVGEYYCDGDNARFEYKVCDAGCSVGACKTTCTDSDGGKNYNIRGDALLSNNQNFTDSCTINTLTEYYCKDGLALSENKTCANGCSAGACRETLGCTDSDGGKTYGTVGTATDASGSGTDLCPNSLKLSEYYCNGDVKAFEQVDCANGCENGACKSTTACTPNWTCSSWGTCSNSSQVRTCSQSNCTSQSLTKTETQSCTISQACSDPDGKDYFKKETMTYKGITYTDKCDSRYPTFVLEYYCNSLGEGKGEWGTCVNGCLDGACKPVTNCTPTWTCSSWGTCTNSSQSRICTDSNNCGVITNKPAETQSCITSLTCTDTDVNSTYPDGKNYFTEGTTTSSSGSSTDYCESGYYLWEYYCNGSTSTREYKYCDYGCDSEKKACRKRTCSDSDNGKIYNVKGTTVFTSEYGQETTKIDSCSSGYLNEYYCDSNNSWAVEYKTCELGCKDDGSCGSTALSCSDSDGGIIYDIKGTVTDQDNAKSDDVCVTSGSEVGKLKEYYCTGNQVNFEYKTCANGCENGACKSTTACTPNWTCSSWGTCSNSSQVRTCSQSNCTSQSLTKTETQSCTVSQTCSDPDGKDYFRKETLIYKGVSYTDRCDSRYPTYVLEYYCDSLGVGKSEWGSCANGCGNGACNPVTNCTPNWACSSWGTCSNSSQSRTCTDSNSCGVTTNKPAETQSCSMPGACSDSDNGKEYFTKGFAINSSGQRSEDICSGNQLTEYYCKTDGSGASMFEFKQCDYGIGAYKCENGACVATTCTPNYSSCTAWSACMSGSRSQTCTQTNCPLLPPTQTKTESCVVSGTCTDSDGGEIYGTRGTITLGTRSYTDYCNTSNSNYLYEYYCDASGVGKVRSNYKCADGCLDGACRTSVDTCVPSYTSCTAWSACAGGQKTQTCTQTNCPSLPPTKTNTESCIVEITCSDDDNGKIYGIKGTTTDTTGSSTDLCYTNVLTEYYCDGNTKKYESYACDNGCYAGACASLACTDSDGGKNYWFKGYINAGGVTTDDVCTGSNTLFEYYCDGNTVKIDPKNCEYGCDNNGACKTNNATCFDSDGGLNAVSKGFVIIGNTSNTDTCVSANVLTEYACSTDRQLMKIDTSCNSDCVNGACTPATNCTPNYSACGAWSACTSGAQTQTCTQTNCPALSPTKTNTKICTTTCTDSDQYCSNGACESNNPLLKGILTYTDLDGKVEITEDVCMERDDYYKGKILTENFCQTVNGFANWTSEEKVCDNGCINGSCNTHAECQNQKCVFVSGAGTNSCTIGNDSTCSGGSGSCTDTDGGRSYFARGEVTSYDVTNGNRKTYDSCSGNQLTEQYCDGTTAKTETYWCDNGCLNGSCIGSVCRETDGGRDYNVRGVTTNANGLASADYCQSTSSLGEYYCGEDKVTSYLESKSCENGCENGACKVITSLCTDSDNGKDYFVKGTTSIAGGTSLIDQCVDGMQLKEYYCTASTATTISTEYKNCENGCANGLCKPVVSQTCSDPDGKNYYKKDTMAYLGITYTDYCDSKYPGYVVEYYCDSAGVGKAQYGSCGNSTCFSGACK